jgi:hypothetical protein
LKLTGGFLMLKQREVEGTYDVFLFSYDVVSYSKNKSFEQVEIQKQLDELLEHSIPKESFIGFNDEGDGGFVILDCKNELDVALTCLKKFDILIRRKRHNGIISFEVRYALHEGRVTIKKRPSGGVAYSGTAINECRRMISGMPNSKPGQVLCSSKHKETLIQDAAIEEELFTDLGNFRVKNTDLTNISSYFDGQTGYDWRKVLKDGDAGEPTTVRETVPLAAIYRIKEKLSKTAIKLFWAMVLLGLAVLFLAPQ